MPKIIINDTAYYGTISIHSYGTRRVALKFSNPVDGPLAVLTVYVHGLKPNEIGFPEYKQKGVMTQLCNKDICMGPIQHIRSGYVSIPVCVLHPNWRENIENWNKEEEYPEEEDTSAAEQALEDQQYDQL